MRRRTDVTKGARAGRGTLGGVLAALVAVVIACSGSNGNGLGSGSALCGVSGTAQCPGNLQCSPKLGCVACVEDSNCSQPNPVCIVGTGRCGACAKNSDCASGLSCWPGDAQCHQPCTVDSD